MRNVIWKRYYGEWVFIDGQMLWIPPRYYMFLNFWHMNTEKGYELPEFRIRDWKSHCVSHYLRHTKEAFGNLNKDGVAIKVDGKYEVINKGARVFYGPIRPKNRRSGATHEALNEGHETVCTGIGKKATTISKSVTDVIDFFEEMLFPAWRRMPMFLKPIWRGAQVDGRKIEYKTQTTTFGIKGMDSVMYYVLSTDEVILDSKRFDFILFDEQGKETGGGRVDVSKRSDVGMQTLSTGSGAKIHGFCMNPSTAEEMEDGAEEYKSMCDMSSFYQRSEIGQTKTGLMLIYFPAQYCLEGFVDCFGKAVVGAPTERQIRLMRKHFPHKDNPFADNGIGAREHLLAQRNQLLASGRPEDLKKYRGLQRKHPMKYDESWIGDSGDMGFPMIKIDARIAEASNMSEPLVDYGKFEWQGPFGGRVRWVPLSERDRDARFELSYHIKSQFANRDKRVRAFNGITNLWEWHKGPDNPRFILGGDTFGYDNKSEVKMRQDPSDKSRKSDGGIGGYYPFDAQVDGGKDRGAWDSDRFILSYRAKPPSTDAYNEDLLMAAIYLGAWVYPERNITNTWEYFIKKGYGGYLKYDINISTGKPNDRPGYWLGKEGKVDMFQLINDYLDRNASRERHVAFLKECKNIRGPEYLKDFDRIAAHGAALMGARDMSVTQVSTDKHNRIKEAYEELRKVF
jgi:hypothetical protein